MNISKRTRGAVSVFLVMILVPCMLATSVFVDLGRVHLSKSMADSAGDLALNSLMTNYDGDLNEWYGMVASCQNIEQFYTESAQYFLRILSSQGLSEDEILTIYDYYSYVTTEDKIYDLLKAEPRTAPGDMIKAVDNADLSNAAMLKDKVVEFMKYRAPIELTTSIIDRLTNDTTVGGAIDAEPNQPLVESKQKFYEAEGELLAAAFNTYAAICEYYSPARRPAENMSGDKLRDYETKINSYKNVYADIHRLTVSNLLNTEGLQQYQRVTGSLNTYEYGGGDVCTSSETAGGKVSYHINGSGITALLDELEASINGFNAAKADFENAAAPLMADLPGSGDDQANFIQWWVLMDEAVNAPNGCTLQLAAAADRLLKAYAKALAIIDCAPDEDVPPDWEARFYGLTDTAEAVHGRYLTAAQSDPNDAYLNAVCKLEDISSENLNNIEPTGLQISVNGQNMSAASAIPHIKNDLSSIKSQLQSYIDALETAINGNENDPGVAEKDRIRPLDGLLELAERYRIAFAEWSSTAEATGTEMAEEDLAEIAEIREMYGEITPDSVVTLKTRLQNIQSQFSAVIAAVDSMRYGGESPANISSFASFKNILLTAVDGGNIPLKNGELNIYADSTFKELFVPDSEGDVLTLEHMDDPDYNPMIDPNTAQVNTPGLFIYLHSKFKGASKPDVDEQQEELENGENDGNDKEDETKDKGRYHGGGESIQHSAEDFPATGTFHLIGDSISGVLNLFDSLIHLDVKSIRDDLYVTAYMMNMFSYATYEAEGLYSLVPNKTELKLPHSPDYYPPEYSGVMGSPDAEGTWLSVHLKDSYNKSLTNKPIDKGANAAYCAEIEYILYGKLNEDGTGSDNNANVKAAYDHIYGVRYVLNLISGFANFWSAGNPTADAIDAVAFTIWSLTNGIIPKALTKIVLIPILTAFETSKDLDRFEAGFPVEVYKTTYDKWWIKVPNGASVSGIGGLLSLFKDPEPCANTGKGIFYSDYLTVFVYLGLNSDLAEAMYQRMAEVIQANMRKLTGSGTYSMKKARLYFRLDAKMRVNPLMIALPFFNGSGYSGGSVPIGDRPVNSSPPGNRPVESPSPGNRPVESSPPGNRPVESPPPAAPSPPGNRPANEPGKGGDRPVGDRPVGDPGGNAGGTDWCTYTISAVRGY